MTNRSDEPAPGVQRHGRADDALDGLPLGDGLAAGQVPLDRARARRSSFEFTPNYPGVFMYHCGTPMVLEHIASGMYGMMIVEPRDGYPTKVDREYAVVQSEFYTKPDPQKRKVDGQPLYVLDGDRVRAKAPTYTVFNGRYNGMVDKPLPAKPGERVRLFVMNVGPVEHLELPRRRHDLRSRVDGRQSRQPVPRHADGAARLLERRDRRVHHPRGRQLRDGRPPLRQRLAGRDRHHRRGRQARGGRGRPRAPQHPGHGGAHRRRGACSGKLAFESKCLACHSIAGGDKLGPDLYQRDQAPRRRLAHALAEVSRADAADRCHGEGRCSTSTRCRCPTRTCPTQEISEYLAYFKWADANIRPQGTTQPQPAAPGLRGTLRRRFRPPRWPPPAKSK